MILIDNIKYACMECIRGHRSSSCKHHTRPLLQVRSKGRPVVYANGNPNHRIAVFAEEIDETTPTNYEEDSISCKSQPIVILKCSSKQVIDLNSGELIGPYDESKTQPNILQKQQQPKIIINDDSFINTSSCCTPKISKGKSCNCCNNKKKSVNKSQIIKSYITKKLNQDVQQNVELIPSCTIPGTCCCNDDCKCNGCEVHNNNNNNNNNDNNSNNNYKRPEEPISFCSCPPDSCDCTNCETHGIINGLKLDEYFNDNLHDFLLQDLSQLFPP
ncbi:unnamed protein product [Candida verbasci]|uniref:Copper-fist domain-containing protein n=1 Tax=Candida verbasci TaxID=1227364 RepID=A0A9W4XIP7_9ASCO|nr:unnamed protein product [Candida verbasci]